MNDLKTQIIEVAPISAKDVQELLMHSVDQWPTEYFPALHWAVEVINKAFENLIVDRKASRVTLNDLVICRSFIVDNLPDGDRVQRIVLVLLSLEETFRFFLDETAEEEFLAVYTSFNKMIESLNDKLATMVDDVQH